MYKRIDPTGYSIEGTKAADLMPYYEPFFAPLVGRGIKLLELGVAAGASLRFWRDYFENAMIVGLDCDAPVKIDDPNGKIHIYQGYQQDTQLLDRIAKERAPDGFDVVIDDCSHIGRFARISFWHLFQNHLKPGGLYCIEDWETGYYPWRGYDSKLYKPKSKLHYPCKERFLDTLSAKLSQIFPNGINLSFIRANPSSIPQRFFIRTTIPSHMHGMVGFIKEIIDASSEEEKAIPRSGSGRYLHYNISQVHVTQPLVIVEKAAERRGRGNE